MAHGLATALLAGEWHRAAMQARAAAALGRRISPLWLRALVDQAIETYPRAPQDSPRELAALLMVLPAWSTGTIQRRRSDRPAPRPLRPVHWAPTPTSMGPARWPIAPLDDVAALAGLLDLRIPELEWFADVRGWERTVDPALRHYRVSTRPKAGGAVRVIEAPKPRLREIQRRLVRHLLAPIAIHPAAHGCVPGRSVASALAGHTGRRTIVRCDLKSFFAAINAGRIYGVLRTTGLPEAVAHAVTGLCTTTMSAARWREIPYPTTDSARQSHRRLGRLLATPHLPQGAPTSPALANLVAFSLDRRLAGLATALGLHYTRYVDDLIFSGDTLRSAALIRAIERISTEEGFRLAPAKTVTYSSSQRQPLLGAVVNHHVTAPRREIDRLRAIVHNCVTRGWASQARGQTAEDFRARLTGRIAWVNGLDQRRGAQLTERAAAIDWS